MGAELSIVRSYSGTTGSDSGGAVSTAGAIVGGIKFGAGISNQMVQAGFFGAFLSESGTFSDTSKPTDFRFYTNPNGAIVPTEKVRITSEGNVGIGSTIPTSKLDIVGDVQVVGVVTATSFSGDGSALTGIGTAHVSTFDLVVAGISTFNKQVKILNSGLDIAGVATFANVTGPSGSDSRIYAHTEGGATSGTLVLEGKQDLRLNTGGFSRWILDGGDLVTHGTTYHNLGAASASGGRVGNGYFQTSVDLIDDGELRLGTGDDLKIYHDGSNSYISEAGTGNLIN